MTSRVGKILTKLDEAIHGLEWLLAALRNMLDGSTANSAPWPKASTPRLRREARCCDRDRCGGARGWFSAQTGAQTPAPAPPAPPAVANANGVDMCTILTDPELTALGGRPDTRTSFNKAGVVVCRWQGTSFMLSLERDNATLADYERTARSTLFNFMDNT